MLNKELEYTLHLSFKTAKENRQQFLTVEHLLLALVNNPSTASLLLAYGAPLGELREELQSYINASVSLIPKKGTKKETLPSQAYQRVLQRALILSKTISGGEINGSIVLLAIFSEPDSHAVSLLKKHGINDDDLEDYIKNGRRPLHFQKNEAGKEEDEFDHFIHQNEEEADDDDEQALNLLEKYTVNLNHLAKAGKVDPLIGRENELARLMQILCRRRKNNPILVGESGVGKTALIEGLAALFNSKETPKALQGTMIYALDMGGLLAGTKYRGDFEKRFKCLLAELATRNDAVLFIDEIHTIIGAGSTAGSIVDASNLLKPMLEGGKIKCIGCINFKEYRSIFTKETGLSRRFQKIDLSEPSIDETVAILTGLKGRLEKHHQVKFSLDAFKAAAKLSAKHLTNRYLPDKAIDIIDEAGAKQMLHANTQRKKTITERDIEAIIANVARIPEKAVSSSDKGILQNLNSDLKKLVYGQDQAIDALSSVIKLSRSGLGDPNKPVGSFLFTGPTGVGKTEVTQQLAQTLGIELLRFDMSEYMERHAASRLIGAPPGYVGYEEGGLLTDAVTKHPHAVVLLDEIEKAHPDVFNLLLQVMDNGFLTDSNGRKADFRHVILVMTTNAGAFELSRNNIGFGSQDNSSDGLGAIKRCFTPEFRNRLDAIVQFTALEIDSISSVVDKFINELAIQLKDQGVSLELSMGAKQWFVENGYDRTMGARPMARLIQEQLKKPLAEELLFGKLSKGGQVKIHTQQGKINLKIKEMRESIGFNRIRKVLPAAPYRRYCDPSS